MAALPAFLKMLQPFVTWQWCHSRSEQYKRISYCANREDPSQEAHPRWPPT